MPAPSHLRTCPAPGRVGPTCGSILRACQFFCKVHWFKIPNALRLEVIAGSHKSPEAGAAAIQRAIDALAELAQPGPSAEQRLEQAAAIDSAPATQRNERLKRRWSEVEQRRRQRGRR